MMRTRLRLVRDEVCAATIGGRSARPRIAGRDQLQAGFALVQALTSSGGGSFLNTVL